MSKITRDSVKSALSAAGCTMRRVAGQWRVNVKGMGEGQAYYADSLQDAHDTGLAMVEEHHRMEMVRYQTHLANQTAFMQAQALLDAQHRARLLASV